MRGSARQRPATSWDSELRRRPSGCRKRLPRRHPRWLPAAGRRGCCGGFQPSRRGPPAWATRRQGASPPATRARACQMCARACPTTAERPWSLSSRYSGLGECDGAKAGDKGPPELNVKKSSIYSEEEEKIYTRPLRIPLHVSTNVCGGACGGAVRQRCGSSGSGGMVVVWQCGRGAAVVRQRCGRGAVTVRWRRGGDVSSAAALRQRRGQRCGSGAGTVSCPVEAGR